MKTLLSSQSIKLNKFTIFVNLYKYDTNREYYDISYVKNDENDKFDILDGEIIPKSHITIQLVKILLQESITDEDFAKIEKLSKYISNLSNERISCKIVTFTVFGLSLATINAFVSLVISFITFKMFLSYEKK